MTVERVEPGKNGLTMNMIVFLLCVGVHSEVLKLLKHLHDNPELHNAFLEYCLPPSNEEKLYKLMDTVRVYMHTCILW